MQNSNKAGFSTPVVFTKDKQRLRDRFKKDLEHHGFVTQDNGVQFVRQGEDDMEVADRQELLLASFGPFFSGHLLALGAMSITAGMVGDALSAAVVAAFNVTAKAGGTAV